MMLFIPYPDWNTPTIDYSKAKQVQRVDLREVPLDTIIQFKGIHPSSRYLCRIVEQDSIRKIKIWFGQKANCAIGPIEAIISFHLDLESKERIEEKAVMRIGECYELPYFHFEGEHFENIRLDYLNFRMEAYSKIRIQTPELLK